MLCGNLKGKSVKEEIYGYMSASLVAQLVKNLPAIQETPVWSLGKGIGSPLQYSWAFLVAKMVKNPPAIWETWVQSLG